MLLMRKKVIYYFQVFIKHCFFNFLFSKDNYGKTIFTVMDSSFIVLQLECEALKIDINEMFEFPSVEMSISKYELKGIL